MDYHDLHNLEMESCLKKAYLFKGPRNMYKFESLTTIVRHIALEGFSCDDRVTSSRYPPS